VANQQANKPTAKIGTAIEIDDAERIGRRDRPIAL
jgi:hypothetical protein